MQPVSRASKSRVILLFLRIGCKNSARFDADWLEYVVRAFNLIWGLANLLFLGQLEQTRNKPRLVHRATVEFGYVLACQGMKKNM